MNAVVVLWGEVVEFVCALLDIGRAIDAGDVIDGADEPPSFEGSHGGNVNRHRENSGIRDGDQIGGEEDEKLSEGILRPRDLYTIDFAIHLNLGKVFQVLLSYLE